jgi:hypothetical protein
MYSLITICAVQERMRTDIDKFPSNFTIENSQESLSEKREDLVNFV